MRVLPDYIKKLEEFDSYEIDAVYLKDYNKSIQVFSFIVMGYNDNEILISRQYDIIVKLSKAVYVTKYIQELSSIFGCVVNYTKGGAL